MPFSEEPEESQPGALSRQRGCLEGGGTREEHRASFPRAPIAAKGKQDDPHPKPGQDVPKREKGGQAPQSGDVRGTDLHPVGTQWGRQDHHHFNAHGTARAHCRQGHHLRQKHRHRHGRNQAVPRSLSPARHSLRRLDCPRASQSLLRIQRRRQAPSARIRPQNDPRPRFAGKGRRSRQESIRRTKEETLRRHCLYRRFLSRFA